MGGVRSRGFDAGFDALLPPARPARAGDDATTPAGGNVALLRQLPRLAQWLRKVDAAGIHAPNQTSHGTLAWLAQRVYGVRGRLVGSAWGSDILVSPGKSALVRSATRRVLRACVLTTSDSHAMAARMRELGARDVMVFPFGLEAMPPPPPPKDARLYFANRALEPLYAPERVLRLFEGVASRLAGRAPRRRQRRAR